jgi:hypothetical protein
VDICSRHSDRETDRQVLKLTKQEVGGGGTTGNLAWTETKGGKETLLVRIASFFPCNMGLTGGRRELIVTHIAFLNSSPLNF